MSGVNLNSSVSNSYYNNTASNVNINTYQRATENKTVSNPALDDLSKLLADPSKVAAKEDNTDPIKDQLVSIDNELNDMQKFLDELDLKAERTQDEKNALLTLLSTMISRLGELESQLQQLADASRQRGQTDKDVLATSSTSNLLKNQIDAQREALKASAEQTDTQNDAPAAPPQAV